MTPDKNRALMHTKRMMPEFVCDAVNLEGLNFTIPEIQTLLDGITVGGHKVSDQQVALNQANAWKYIFSLVENDNFKVDMLTVNKIHKLAAKEDALTWGKFRDGIVTIAGTLYTPPMSEQLPEQFDLMLSTAFEYIDVYDRAIHYFLAMARNQFYHDVNKRTGRFVMNGFLLQNGFPGINIQAKRKLEFNTLMLEFYETENPVPMNQFIRSCLDTRIIGDMKILL
ncbi:Fic family protein [Desulfobacter sp.]|uniref:Fic family protein n=1 Tax=Desulfobacter sp. TaxID=2294 RepID=UPI003D149229